MDDQARYAEAKKQVREIKGFYHHLAVYVLVNAFLLLVNVVTSPAVLWFYWPLLGWGLGIVAHAASVFAGFTFLGREWEERKIKDLMDKGKSE